MAPLGILEAVGLRGELLSDCPSGLSESDRVSICFVPNRLA